MVMATHSIYLAKDLPNSAIRVMEMGSNGRVSISMDYSADEALHEIGTFPAGKTIIVEDIRAKKIVLGALEKTAQQTLKEFHVQVRAGGTSRIFKDIQAYANSGNNDIFVFFDGDHCPTEAIPSVSLLR